MKLTTEGPLFARALPWPSRPAVTTIVARVVYGVAFDGTATPVTAQAAAEVELREAALHAAESALFKEACEVALVGDEAQHVSEPRSIEVVELDGEGGPISRKRIFGMAGMSLGALPAARAAAGGDEVRAVADSQRIPTPSLPLQLVYLRGTARFEVRLPSGEPHGLRGGRAGSSRIRMVLDGIWLDPGAHRVVCTFRGASFANEGDADEISIVWSAQRQPAQTMVAIEEAPDDLGTSTVSLPLRGANVGAVLPFRGGPVSPPAPAQRLTISNEGQSIPAALPFAPVASPPQSSAPAPTHVAYAAPPLTPIAPPAQPGFAIAAPVGLPAVGSFPVHGGSGFAVSSPDVVTPPRAPNPPPPPPSTPQAVVPPLAVVGSASPSRPPERGTRDELESLHRRAQRAIWEEPERAAEILAAFGLDPIRYRMLKRKLSRPRRG